MTQDKRPIVWLCGFPSSGNLKAQIGLANLLFGRVTSISDLDRKIPPIYSVHALPSSPPERPFNYIFSHHVAEASLLAPRRTDRVIYVIRNPVDCGISSSNWLLPGAVNMASATEAEMDAARRQLVDMYLRIGTYMEYVWFGYGSWPVHPLSWLRFANAQKVPLLLVRFDDMRLQPEATLRRMAEFVGLEPTDAAIADAADNWAMPASRALEEAAIASREVSRFFQPQAQAAYDRGWRYHGSGLSGYGKAMLTPEQWQQARAMFGATAARFKLHIGPED